MRPRVALVVGALSVLGAIVVVVALLLRAPDDASKVATLGSLAPASTTLGTPAPSAGTAAVATFPTATTVPPPIVPTALSIPAIGAAADIVPVGLVSGTDDLEIPDIDHVGWYDLGPSPGQQGTSVLVGHVDGDGRPGVFFHLGELIPGDVIGIEDSAGRHDFRVTGREQMPKDALPADLFSRDGTTRLVLITCGGAFDDATGHYLDNVVVVAVPM